MPVLFFPPHRHHEDPEGAEAEARDGADGSRRDDGDLGLLPVVGRLPLQAGAVAALLHQRIRGLGRLHAQPGRGRLRGGSQEEEGAL